MQEERSVQQGQKLSHTPKQIVVRLARLGDSIREISVAQGSTLGQVLEAAGLDVGVDVRLNGRQAGVNDTVHMGDLITIVPRIRGG